jgi:hypothetical protein
MALSELDLEPTCYLGELRELPPAPTQDPGAWCELVVHDHEGEMRWTLVVFESSNDDNKFAGARSLAAGGAAPPVEREGPHLSLPSAAGAGGVIDPRPAALLEEPWERGGRTPRSPGVSG